ncbi:MAG: phosphohistidine phosphatase SixA [Chloroflexi bacterium]|nr:phosphohistidine phosphatase SixA [Chloroflexota bacterium]MCY4247337.1 phosphohistidine phosphatase SixA [Chloroflexota bacterium]
MRLYFVRHGIAEDLTSSDFMRELTPRGERRVKTSAAVMRALGIQPQRIYSSPRLRARQTADIIAQALGMGVELADSVNFGFDLADARRLSADCDAEIMFVGHNPDMSEIVSELTGAAVSMKKGGLARVDAFAAEAGAGELVWLVAPKVFDALADNKQTGIVPAPAQKLPDVNGGLHELIRQRWSPVGFDRERPIKRETLLGILEAARWAASSSNLQPWRFIVARREDEAQFAKLLLTLREGNIAWAQHAAALMVACSRKFRKETVPNRHAGHDLGLAVGQMVLQALSQGVYVHQMGGFFPEKARQLYAIPDDFDPYTCIAFGYRATELGHLAEAQRGRDASPRERQPLDEMVFGGGWAQAANFLD